MRTLNVTETARLLDISQPSASQTLRDLEFRLGLKLFTRKSGRLMATSHAETLLPEIDRALKQINRVGAIAADLQSETSHSLAVGTLSVVNGTILPSAIAKFQAAHPSTRLKISSLATQEILQQSASEEIDLGILYTAARETPQRAKPLLRTEMVCLSKPGHRLTQSPVLYPGDFAGERLLILDPSACPGRQFYERLGEAREACAALVHVNNSYGAAAMVREGAGIFVTEPLILLSGLTEGLTVHRFEPSLSTELNIVYPETGAISRAATHFTRLLMQAAAAATVELRARGIPAHTPDDA